LKITHEAPLAEYDDLLDGGNRISANLPPYIAVATTSGTGSEVSRSAVITIEKTNRKTVIFSPYLIPSLALGDPDLTLQLPPHITAGTGMDAFTHNVEAYLAKGYHPVCDAVALQGAKLAWQNLPRVMDAPEDREARGAMMMASMMGAIAFQKDLGAVHSCAHALSTVADLHHGLANGIMIDHVMRFNLSAAQDKMAELAHVAGVGGSSASASAQAFIDWLVELKRDLAIPLTLAGYRSTRAVTRADIGALVDVAVNDTCHQTNPRPCARADFERIFAEAIG
jgi:hypothetical protein